MGLKGYLEVTSNVEVVEGWDFNFMEIIFLPPHGMAD